MCESAPSKDVVTLKDVYTQKCMKLLLYRYAYYVHDESLISDYDYDVLEHELEDMEAAHPELVHPRSPTQTVGSSLWSDYPASVRRTGDALVRQAQEMRND